MRQCVLYIDEAHLKEFTELAERGAAEMSAGGIGFPKREPTELERDLLKWIEHQKVSFPNAFTDG